MALIEFKCLFQEIFDFKINLNNWRSSNVNPPDLNGKPKNLPYENIPSTLVKFELLKKGIIQSYTSATSEVAIHQSTPIWSNFSNDVFLRGTVNDLESSEVKISMFKKDLLNTKLGEKVINMRGVFDFERLKSDIQLIDPETKDKYYCNLEGFVNLDKKIKYRQSGENINLVTDKKYLCINVMRVENIRPSETRGIVDSFISVEWVEP